MAHGGKPMTPEDVAKCRLIAEAPDDWAEPDISDALTVLTDALEAAWAERDRLDEYASYQKAEREKLRERAERAEAEVARLNVVIFDNNYVWARDITARNEAQIALARVRARFPAGEFDITAEEIHAAIEGPA